VHYRIDKFPPPVPFKTQIEKPKMSKH
jgi:hypothetical protein